MVGDFVSDFVSGFASDLVSDLVSDFAPSFAPGDAVSEAGFARESVLYQPEPLNTMAGGAMSLRGCFPQFGHVASASSLYDCSAEKAWPQCSQR